MVHFPNAVLFELMMWLEIGGFVTMHVRQSNAVSMEKSKILSNTKSIRRRYILDDVLSLF